jgi:hypothetical protein
MPNPKTNGGQYWQGIPKNSQEDWLVRFGSPRFLPRGLFFKKMVRGGLVPILTLLS